VWQRLVQEAGGPGSAFVVLASAADDPERSAQSIIETLQAYGARARHIPVAVKLATPDWRKAVDDPELIAAVRAARGVYFSGGSQERITQVLLKDGKPSAMLQAIRAVQAQGGLIAGSSAGAAVMSATMFNDPQPVLDILRTGIRPGQDLAPGLGFLPSDILVDQHFLKRGRIGRLLPALQRAGLPLGVGVDENTAAFFCGKTLEVVGASGVLVADLRDAEPRKASAAPFAIRNVRLTLLLNGDRYQLDTRAVTASPDRAARPIDPRTAGFKPYHRGPFFVTDVLADGVLAQLMGQLLDSPQSEATGLAFNAARLLPGTPLPADEAAQTRARAGFEFRLHKSPDAQGWFSSSGGEHYTVTGLMLDVRPLRMAYPLYEALPETAPAAGAGAAGPAVSTKGPQAPSTRQ
jgi:cyanophycinase